LPIVLTKNCATGLEVRPNGLTAEEEVGFGQLALHERRNFRDRHSLLVIPAVLFEIVLIPLGIAPSSFESISVANCSAAIGIQTTLYCESATSLALSKCGVTRNDFGRNSPSPLPPRVDRS